MIHRKKNRPALQRRDILTVSLAYVFVFCFLVFDFLIGFVLRNFQGCFDILISLSGLF